MSEPSDASATDYDPRGLIREAYRIEGIEIADCRSIFLDWALGLRADQSPVDGARLLLEHYSAEPVSHPMTEVLKAALIETPRPKRRGGALSRRR